MVPSVSPSLLPCVRAVCVCCSEAVARVHVLRSRPRAEQGFQARRVSVLCVGFLFLVRCQGFRVVCVYYAVRPRGIVSPVHSLWGWDVVGGLRGCPFGAMSASCFDVARVGGHLQQLDWALLPVCSLSRRS
jgi:hypothetical protein